MKCRLPLLSIPLFAVLSSAGCGYAGGIVYHGPVLELIDFLHGSDAVVAFAPNGSSAASDAPMPSSLSGPRVERLWAADIAQQGNRALQAIRDDNETALLLAASRSDAFSAWAAACPARIEPRVLTDELCFDGASQGRITFLLPATPVPLASTASGRLAAGAAAGSSTGDVPCSC